MADAAGCHKSTISRELKHRDSDEDKWKAI
ncbi:MAG: hypothetical protein IMW92_08270 [Bacillales bacterium]|nr:hypothetical protein [Bacillales bacterium]